MKFIYKLFPIFILLASCRSVKQDATETFRFDVSVMTPSKSMKFSDLVEDYKYVQLETDSTSMVGEIKKVSVSGNNLIILSDGIQCFDMNGKHLYSINKKGRGPSEYIEATDMSIDKNQLYIYDNYQYKVLIFDLNTGSFLESFKMNFSAKEIQINGELLMCNRGPIPNQTVKNTNQLLITYRSDQENISSFIPRDTPYMAVSNQFYGNNRQYYWLEPIFNKVYRLQDNKPSPYLHLDFGDRAITKKEFAKDPPLSTFSDAGKAFLLSTCLETDRLIYSRVQLGEQIMDVWINKTRKVATCFEKLIKAPYQFAPGAQCSSDTHFYRVVPVLEANFMKFDMEEKGFQLVPNNPDYHNYKIVKDFKESNNPILAIYKMKL